METKRIILYIAGLLVLLAIVFLPGYLKLKHLKEENIRYQKRIRLLEEHNEKLNSELAKLREDPSYLEKTARDKLGVVRKGEIIYQRSSQRTE